MTYKQEIREFLATLAKKEILIDDDTSLVAARVVDSLKIAELILFLENHYQLTFESQDLTPENFDSINAVAQLVERKMGHGE